MRAVIVTVMLFGSSVLFAQVKPPALYIDRGACPFECCTYRQWTTTEDTVLYARPDARSPRVATARKGTKVRGLTGEVRTIQPGRFVVSKRREIYRPGDVLWVYTPQGEGFYKVWFKGRMRSESMDNMSGPYETNMIPCAESRDCWGELKQDIKTVWWVKVRDASGRIGWTDKPENFGDKDSCG